MSDDAVNEITSVEDNILLIRFIYNFYFICFIKLSHYEEGNARRGNLICNKSASAPPILKGRFQSFSQANYFSINTAYRAKMWNDVFIKHFYFFSFLYLNVKLTVCPA